MPLINMKYDMNMLCRTEKKKKKKKGHPFSSTTLHKLKVHSHRRLRRKDCFSLNASVLGLLLMTQSFSSMNGVAKLLNQSAAQEQDADIR